MNDHILWIEATILKSILILSNCIIWKLALAIYLIAVILLLFITKIFKVHSVIIFHSFKTSNKSHTCVPKVYYLVRIGAAICLNLFTLPVCVYTLSYIFFNTSTLKQLIKCCQPCNNCITLFLNCSFYSSLPHASYSL